MDGPDKLLVGILMQNRATLRVVLLNGRIGFESFFLPESSYKQSTRTEFGEEIEQ